MGGTLGNPYRPGSGTAPPLLAGRAREIADFERLVSDLCVRGQQRNLLATGLRGVGKTVLLNRFEVVAQGAGIPVAFLEVERSNLANGVARRISTVLGKLRPVRKLKQSLMSTLDGLLVFTLRDPGTSLELSLNVQIPSPDLLADDFADLLICLGEVADAQGQGVIFLFDELHNADPAELGAFLTGLHRVAQKELPVSMVGAGLPSLSATVGTAREYAERMFSAISIGALKRPDAALALTGPVRRFNVDFEKSAEERVLKLTEGYPYFIQEYGYQVWNCLDGDVITDAVVDLAEPLARAALDQGFFQLRLDRATAEGRKYLRKMAALGQGPSRISAIESSLGGKRRSKLHTREELLRTGLIFEPEEGVLDYTVPRFGEFMIRRFPAG